MLKLVSFLFGLLALAFLSTGADAREAWEGHDHRCGAIDGVCINTDTSTCLGDARETSGLCPGDANIKCCVPWHSVGFEYLRVGGPLQARHENKGKRCVARSGKCILASGDEETDRENCSGNLSLGYCGGPMMVLCCVKHGTFNEKNYNDVMGNVRRNRPSKVAKFATKLDNCKIPGLGGYPCEQQGGHCHFRPNGKFDKDDDDGKYVSGLCPGKGTKCFKDGSNDITPACYGEERRVPAPQSTCESDRGFHCILPVQADGTAEETCGEFVPAGNTLGCPPSTTCCSNQQDETSPVVNDANTARSICVAGGGTCYDLDKLKLKRSSIKKCESGISSYDGVLDAKGRSCGHFGTDNLRVACCPLPRTKAEIDATKFTATDSPCYSNGGFCTDITKAPRCSLNKDGLYTSGGCDGIGRNFHCCITDGNPPNVILEPPTDSTGDGYCDKESPSGLRIKGQCIDTSKDSKTCPENHLVSGHCTGAASVKCCVTFTDSPESAAPESSPRDVESDGMQLTPATRQFLVAVFKSPDCQRNSQYGNPEWNAAVAMRTTVKLSDKRAIGLSPFVAALDNALASSSPTGLSFTKGTRPFCEPGSWDPTRSDAVTPAERMFTLGMAAGIGGVVPSDMAQRFQEELLLRKGEEVAASQELIRHWVTQGEIPEELLTTTVMENMDADEWWNSVGQGDIQNSGEAREYVQSGGSSESASVTPTTSSSGNCGYDPSIKPWSVPCNIHAAEHWNRYLAATVTNAPTDKIPAPNVEHFGVFCGAMPSTTFPNSIAAMGKTIDDIGGASFHPNARFNQLTPAFKDAVFVSPECTDSNGFGNRAWATGANEPTTTEFATSSNPLKRSIKGLKGFVKALDAAFNDFKENHSGALDSYKQAGGLYCKKPALARSGIPSFSNHAYGLAVDLSAGGNPKLYVERGIAELAPYLTNRMIKWQVDDDAMHFDASQELVREWIKHDVENPDAEPMIPSELVTQEAKDNVNDDMWWNKFKCRHKMVMYGIWNQEDADKVPPEPGMTPTSPSRGDTTTRNLPTCTAVHSKPTRTKAGTNPCPDAGGMCISTTSCQCSGELRSGMCPGDSSVKCCVSGDGQSALSTEVISDSHHSGWNGQK